MAFRNTPWIPAVALIVLIAFLVPSRVLSQTQTINQAATQTSTEISALNVHAVISLNDAAHVEALYTKLSEIVENLQSTQITKMIVGLDSGALQWGSDSGAVPPYVANALGMIFEKTGDLIMFPSTATELASIRSLADETTPSIQGLFTGASISPDATTMLAIRADLIELANSAVTSQTFAAASGADFTVSFSTASSGFDQAGPPTLVVTMATGGAATTTTTTTTPGMTTTTSTSTITGTAPGNATTTTSSASKIGVAGTIGICLVANIVA